MSGPPPPVLPPCVVTASTPPPPPLDGEEEGAGLDEQPSAGINSDPSEADSSRRISGEGTLGLSTSFNSDLLNPSAPAPSLAPSPRASLARNSLTVPSIYDEGPPPPGGANGAGGLAPPPQMLQTRRCSARLLSLNVREALRQLRQREHRKRVTALVQRNANFYRRQRCCECGTMTSALALFSAFSLYVIFAYGFYLGQREEFRMEQELFPTKVKGQQGGSIEVWCQSSTYWEWCRWIHFDRYCDYEWFPSSGVEETSCNFAPGKVELIGDYDGFQCGLRISDLDARDRGSWLCEVEKYYMGFSRRYGEVRTAGTNVLVSGASALNLSGDNVDPGLVFPRRSTPNPNGVLLLPSTDQATARVPASVTPPPSRHTPSLGEEGDDNRTASVAAASNSWSWTTPIPIEKTEEYKKQFFLVKVFILGGIGTVFAILAVIFWIYFMYLWRSWETNKRPGAVEDDEIGGGGMRDNDLYGDDVLSDADMVNASLLHSRRKSVSFAVCRLNQENPGDKDSAFSFEITNRSVTIAAGGSSIGGGGGSNAGSRSGSNAGSSNTITAGGSVGGLSGASSGGGPVIRLPASFSTSPTPSAPSAMGDWRRGSMDPPTAPRRLSLAPEDALLQHSYSLYSPSASASRARFLRRESEGSTNQQQLRQQVRLEKQQKQQQEQQQQQQQGAIGGGGGSTKETAI